MTENKKTAISTIKTIFKWFFVTVLLFFAVISINQGLQNASDPEELKKEYAIVSATVTGLFERRINEHRYGNNRAIDYEVIPELSYVLNGVPVKKEAENFSWNKAQPPKLAARETIEIWINKNTGHIHPAGYMGEDSRTINILMGVVFLVFAYRVGFGRWLFFKGHKRPVD